MADESTTPTAATPLDEGKIAASVTSAYEQWRPYRRQHEGQWFLNAAFLRGQQHVEYNDSLAKLIVPDAPSYAVRISLNKIRPKHKARMSKFFKNRPKPVVIAASTDHEDLMDARATERALRYQWDRLNLELAYREARQFAAICAKAFWWFGYDETVPGRVRVTNPVNGEKQELQVPLGDLTVEVGTAWEVLVKDPSIERLGLQPELLRVRYLDRAEARRRYPQLADGDASGAATGDSPRQTADKLSTLVGDGGSTQLPKRTGQVLLLEHYMAPCAKYPKGRKAVVCEGKLVKYEEELPFEFWDSPTNPYPCVEFSDTSTPGQFWGTTANEQLIDIQRTFNDVVGKVVENIRAVSRPKIVVYKQHNLPDGAWTSAAGEILELTYVPGLPPPQIIQAANVAGDCWNMIQFLEREFDNISQIYPSSEGRVAGAESGYQTSLLQEATDSVHTPEIRADELAIQDAAWKIRRIMKLTWDVPRLIAIGGESSAPEMIEFSQRQINDAAEVRIQIGSMLPDLKAAKAQVMLNFYEKGLLGDPNDPMVKRRALGLMEMGGYEVLNEEERLDEAESERENQTIRDGGGVDPAKFFHQHMIHIYKHEAAMKKPEWSSMPKDRQLVHVAHLITHYDWVNPPLAQGLRQQYGLVQLPVATPPPPPMPPPNMGAPSGPPPAGQPVSGPPAAPSPMPAAPPPQ